MLFARPPTRGRIANKDNLYLRLSVQHFPQLLIARGGWLALTIPTWINPGRHRVGGLPCTAYCNPGINQADGENRVPCGASRENGAV